MSNYSRPVITQGNDFTIRIAIQHFVDGDFVDFNINTIKSLEVYLICSTHNQKIPLKWEIEPGFDNIISCFVNYYLVHASASYGIGVEGIDENDKHFRWYMLPKEGILVINNTSGQNIPQDVEIVDCSARVGWGIQTDADLTNYYTKTEVDNMIAEIEVEISDTYTKEEINQLLTQYPTKTEINTRFNDYYTKTQTNNLLNLKANKSELSTVATTGDYNDLINKPNLNNYATKSDLNNYYDKGQTDGMLNSKVDTSTLVSEYYNKNTVNNLLDTKADTSDLNDFYDKQETNTLLSQKANITDLNNKQDTLVSGTNIKTINNQSILGSGNIDIQGGGGTQVQSDWDEADTTDPSYIKNKPDLSIYAETSDLAVVSTTGDYDDLTNKPDLSVYATHTELNTKQDTLVSGSNIKTINNLSLLGSGNITIQDTRNIPFNESTQNITANPGVDGNHGWRNFISVGGGADYIGTINNSFLIADRNSFYDIVDCLMLGWNSTYYGLHNSIGATEVSSIQFVNANVKGSIFVGTNLRAYSAERNLLPVAAFGYHINIPEPTDTPLFILGTYNYTGNNGVPYNSAVLTIGAGNSNQGKNAVIVSKDGNLLIQPYNSTADTTAHYFEDIDGMVNVGKTLIALNNLYNTLYASKQDTLVSGTNIKTINNQSLLGSGNIDIDAENNDEVTANALYDINGRLSEAEISLKLIPQDIDANITAVNERIDEVNNDITDLTDEIDNTNFANSLILTELHNEIDDKQDELVSGTNIKTVNGTSLLGSGDITVSGGVQSNWNETDNTSLAYIQNKPTITQPIQSDWNQNDSGALDFIKNKPAIPDTYVNDTNPMYQYFTITCLTSGTLTCQARSGLSLTLYYKMDSTNAWNTWNINSWSASSINLIADHKYYFKGTKAGLSNSVYITQFGGTAQIELSGNLLSLLYSDNFVNMINSLINDGTAALRRIFYNHTGIISTKNLVIPIGVYQDRVFEEMFMNCTNLEYGPQLLFTNEDSYTDSCKRMFTGCTSLKYLKCTLLTNTAPTAFTNWLQNVASSGTFVKADNMTQWTLDSASGIPVGWVVLNESDLEPSLKYETVTSTTNGLKIEVVQSLPASPDANTIYIIQ